MNGALVTELAAPNVFDTRDFPDGVHVHGRHADRAKHRQDDRRPEAARVTKPVTFDVMLNGGLPSPMGGNGYNLGSMPPR